MSSKRALALGPSQNPARPAGFTDSILRWLLLLPLLGLLSGCAAQSPSAPVPVPAAPPPVTEPPSGKDKGWKPVTG